MDLNKYVCDKIVDDEKYYLFFDEIQKVSEWEKVINSLKATMNVSIFVTGSNSDLLSGELATYLLGRYVSFKIQPFTFSEVCNLKNANENDYENLFRNYIILGGMTQRLRFDEEKQIRTYLSDVYDSIVVKDIISRFIISDIDLFNRVIEYIMTNLSQTFSAENLVKYFKENDDRSVSKDTIYNYLEYMCRGFLIHKVDRYDVRGKRILTGKYKYYLTDLGLGQILNTTKKEQLGAYLENIVYNELIYRGYDVKVGTLDKGEIDFIATKYGEKIYIQVAYVSADENVIERKFGAYMNIQDNYPKYVLTTDKFDFSHEGIIHKNIIDWLLEKLFDLYFGGFMYQAYLNKIKDKNDRFLLSTTLDKYRQFIKNNKSISTSFLNEYEYKFLVNSLFYLKIPYNSYRVNEYCDKYIIYFGEYLDFVHVYKISDIFTHSEILGTLFSVGYTYDKIGDIIIDDDCCYVTNLSKYDHLLDEIKMISNKPVKFIRIDNFTVNRDKYIVKNIIVPSLRLDVIVSKLCNLSRGKASELINSKKILVNYKEVNSVSFQLKYDDILSIRGYGKYKIGNCYLKTKKDNVLLTINQYS